MGSMFSVGGLMCFVGALFCLRGGGRDYYDPVLWLQLAGMIGTVAGVLLLLVGAKRRARIAERAKAPVTDKRPASAGRNL